MIQDVMKSAIQNDKRMFDEYEIAAAAGVVKAVAVGMFSLQMSGVLTFRESMTVGELESAIDRAAGCAMEKFVQHAIDFDSGNKSN